VVQVVEDRVLGGAEALGFTPNDVQLLVGSPKAGHTRLYGPFPFRGTAQLQTPPTLCIIAYCRS
jgi:hypothetical protein